MTDSLCTEITCVVDRSGSMEAIKSDAIGGFNSFLSEQKREPGETRFSLVLFNHEYELVYDGQDIQKIPDLNEKNYTPSGTTALLDAVGRTIETTEKKVSKQRIEDNPDGVIIAILTDGLENSSTDYTRQKIFDLIQEKREKHGWEFIFLGANQDAMREARHLAISPDDAMSFVRSKEGMRHAFDAMSVRVSEKKRRYIEERRKRESEKTRKSSKLYQ